MLSANVAGTGANLGGTAGTTNGGASAQGGMAASAPGSSGTAGAAATGAGGNVAGGGAAGGGGTAAAGAAAGGAGAGGENAGGGPGVPVEELEDFSFFVTSMEKMLELSGSPDGFGGDLRFGEETGLAGADKICTTIAESSMPGAAAKQWRAFLSVTDDGTGNPVHAIERIGEGPWYDRNGRLIAQDIAGLLAIRPDGDPQAVMDMANEKGEPNHFYNGVEVDNHDTLTGSNPEGKLNSDDPDDTCADWTRNDEPLGTPMGGHSWPRVPDILEFGGHWMSDHTFQGCRARVNLEYDGVGQSGCFGVGCGGGYGGIYCFALMP